LLDIIKLKNYFRHIYSYNSNQTSALQKLTPEELDYCKAQKYIIETSQKRYAATRLGLKFTASNPILDEAEAIRLERCKSLLQVCWEKLDFSELTRVDRVDLKRFGLIGKRAMKLHLPTSLGCEVLGISVEEAQQAFDEKNRLWVLSHPKKFVNRVLSDSTLKRRLAHAEKMRLMTSS
jgi:hypothetical protein